MNLIILTPEKEVFNGTVKSVKVPGAGGAFEVLENHAAIVSALDAGKVNVQPEEGKSINYSITSGFIEVLGKDVSVLAQGLEEA